MRVYNHKAGREQDVKTVLLCNANGYDYRRSAAEYISELESLLRELQNLLTVWQKKTPSYEEIEKRDKLLEKINAIRT